MRVLRDVANAVSSVFGCQHPRLSRPFTIQRQSYLVCLDCGHKMFYSTDEMRRLTRREVRRLHALDGGALRAAPAASADGNDPTIAA